MLLPDINVWLALVFEVHAHNAPAWEWFATLGPQECAFCRFTQQGFLRLATNPSVFKDEAVEMVRAWSLYEKLLKDERVAFCREPEGIEAAWKKHTKQRKYSHRVWSDAYLVAFAECAGMRNVTFDRGFMGYRGVRAVVLNG
jgi:toxin-antitoxin system PIN domain toxin